MADDEAGLVDTEVLPDTSYDPRGAVQNTSNRNALDLRTENFSCTGQETVRHGEEKVPELILAVFVVQFETRRGKFVFLLSFQTCMPKRLLREFLSVTSPLCKLYSTDNESYHLYIIRRRTKQTRMRFF